MKNVNDLIEKLYWDELEKEGITKEDIELVDLDIAFSPVTPFEGCEPCEVKETVGGKNYIVFAPNGTITVSKEELKVMRFRYLQFDPDRVELREKINNFFK